ncbi:MAG: hypothetical protein H0Z34_03725 [Brevibacillus sp.]|nr:hypothetical protein [Brevibacillus sp.]
MSTDKWYPGEGPPPEQPFIRFGRWLRSVSPGSVRPPPVCRLQLGNASRLPLSEWRLVDQQDEQRMLPALTGFLVTAFLPDRHYQVRMGGDPGGAC